MHLFGNKQACITPEQSAHEPPRSLNPDEARVGTLTEVGP